MAKQLGSILTVPENRLGFCVMRGVTEDADLVRTGIGGVGRFVGYACIAARKVVLITAGTDLGTGRTISRPTPKHRAKENNESQQKACFSRHGVLCLRYSNIWIRLL